jgi:methylase of polypeptide subunit release factors
MPQVEITACDIHIEAVDFITKRLAVSALISASQPEQLKMKSKYDAVFALSFFSHMPKTSFTRWMKQLLSFTKPGGFLIFTTHGQQSIKFLPDVQFDKSGFWFQPSSEQKDLDTAEYGTACTRPEYVIGQIFSIPEARLIKFEEAFWWKHQDLYITQRID